MGLPETTPGAAPELPWGTATGVGSMPGTDMDAALGIVFDELVDFPHLPELPARGPGADLVGRGATFLVDIHVDLQPSGWRITDRPGVDARRARDFLARDLDALEKFTVGYTGALKVQAAGPWTLAASLERMRGDRALSDEGACRDIAASLAEGLAAHVEDLRQRVPGATWCVQIDEPSLPGVLLGRVPSVVGYRTVAAVEPPVAVELLRALVDPLRALGTIPVVHSCAGAVPLTTLRSAGFRAIGVDAGLLAPRDDDEIGTTVEAGVGLILGILPTLGPGAPPSVRDVIAPVRQLWHRLGLDLEQLATSVVVAPTCGLAGASPGWARTALRLARQAGSALTDAPGDDRREARS